jgi:hypothetical protein
MKLLGGAAEFNATRSGELLRFIGRTEPRVATLAGLFKWWVVRLNERAGGVDFRRKWKHSYFSYAMVMERGEREGRLHMHALIAGWFDYRVGHKLWFDKVGYVRFESLVDQDQHARAAKVSYLAKYATKGPMAPLVWIQRRPRDLVRISAGEQVKGMCFRQGERWYQIRPGTRRA